MTDFPPLKFTSGFWAEVVFEARNTSGELLPPERRDVWGWSAGAGQNGNFHKKRKRNSTVQQFSTEHQGDTGGCGNQAKILKIGNLIYIGTPWLLSPTGACRKDELLPSGVVQRFKALTGYRSWLRGNGNARGRCITYFQSLLTVTLPPAVYPSKIQMANNNDNNRKKKEKKERKNHHG